MDRSGRRTVKNNLIVDNRDIPKSSVAVVWGIDVERDCGAHRIDNCIAVDGIVFERDSVIDGEQADCAGPHAAFNRITIDRDAMTEVHFELQVFD